MSEINTKVVPIREATPDDYAIDDQIMLADVAAAWRAVKMWREYAAQSPTVTSEAELRLAIDDLEESLDWIEAHFPEDAR